MRNPTAETIKRHAHTDAPWGQCVLTYDGRFLRRKVLTTQDGTDFLVAE